MHPSGGLTDEGEKVVAGLSKCIRPTEWYILLLLVIIINELVSPLHGPLDKQYTHHQIVK